MIGSLFVIVLALGCASVPKPPAWHPTPAEAFARPLSLEDCLRLATGDDLRAAQWQARLKGARADFAAAREIPNPSFNATWEDLGLRDASGANLKAVTYAASYPLLFWWTRGPQKEQARAGIAQGEATNARERRTLAREVGQAYFDLAAAERRVAARRRLLATARDAVRLTSVSLGLGSGSQHAYDQAGTELLQAQSDLNDAQADVRAQGLALAFALGADRPVFARVDEATSVALPLPDGGQLNPTPPEALIARATEVDPAFAEARAARVAAEQTVRLEERRRLPLTDASGTAGRKNAPEGMAGLFALDIPIPIFNWNTGAIRRAKADLEAAQAGEEAARRAAVAQLSTDWQGYLVAERRQRRFAEPLLQRRRRLAAAAETLFEQGEMSFTDLLQARRDRAQAELDATDAWSARQTARWNLRLDLSQNKPTREGQPETPPNAQTGAGQ